MGFFWFIMAMFLVCGPVLLVFKLVFFALKSVFKVTFWVVQGVIVLVGLLFGGGIIAFLGIFFLMNIFALPVIFFCAKR